MRTFDQDSKLIDTGKVSKIIKKEGLTFIELDKAYAGDIVSIAGFPNSRVTHTAVEEGFPQKVIPCLKIDEPLMGVSINVNTSPLAGKEGTKVSLNDLKQRIKEEAENDVALFVDLGGKSSTSIMVRGRGDLHIGILLEKLRR